MTPFKIRIDWYLSTVYPEEPVRVELHIMDEEPKVLRTFGHIETCIAWSKAYLRERGFDYWCDIDLHQRRDDTHITLHPRPLK
jgi:hypothetical protein